MNATSVQAINFRDESCDECLIGCRSHMHGDRYALVTSGSRRLFFHCKRIHVRGQEIAQKLL